MISGVVVGGVDGVMMVVEVIFVEGLHDYISMTLPMAHFDTLVTAWLNLCGYAYDVCQSN